MSVLSVALLLAAGALLASGEFDAATVRQCSSADADSCRFYYIWQFIEVLKGASPLHAVAWLCPVAISGACASIATGKLLGLLRPAWVSIVLESGSPAHIDASQVMTIALSCFLVGTIILATCPVDQVYWGQLFVTVIIMPWGKS